MPRKQVANEHIAQLYRSGLGVLKISRLVHLDPKTVRERLKEADVTMRPRSGAATVVDDKQVIRMYENELLSIAAIARTLRINQGTVRRHLDRAHITIRKTPAIPISDLLKWHNSGLTAEEIAARDDVTLTTLYVEQRLRQAGVPIPLRQPRRTDIPTSRLLALRRQRWSYRRIAEHTGLNARTVYDRLRPREANRPTPS